MAAGIVLVDTGPLVALFDPSDRKREACRRTLEELRQHRRVTTLAVVTEALYLLDFAAKAQQTCLAFLAAGGVELAELTPDDLSRAAALMQRYADLPMDFADASLVVLAERLNTQVVFTLDRRDFTTYRIGKKVFRLLPTD
ncbi:MAG TPA: PIN domain-containing protein [Terriglobales bacterium]|nr:PIN domain-containing protein [Terriglobales bacterium]